MKKSVKPPPTLEEGSAILDPLALELQAHKRGYFMAIEYDDGMRVQGALNPRDALSLICHLADMLHLPNEVVLAALELDSKARKERTEANVEVIFDGRKWNLEKE